MTGSTYEQIAANLSAGPSTVWRTVKRFDWESTVEAKKHHGGEKTDEQPKVVLDNP